MPSLPVEATQVPGLRGGKVVSRCPAIGSSRGPPAVKTRRGSKNLVRPPTENPEEPKFLARFLPQWPHPATQMLTRLEGTPIKEDIFIILSVALKAEHRDGAVPLPSSPC